MQKRGQLLTYKGLIEVLMSFLFVVSFLLAGKSLGSGEFHHKASIAQDIALIIEQFHAMPGDVTFYYPQDVSRYTIKSSANTITVSSFSLVKDPTEVSVTFVGLPMQETKIEKPTQLLIKKSEGKIFLSQDNVQIKKS